MVVSVVDGFVILFLTFVARELHMTFRQMDVESGLGSILWLVGQGVLF